MAKKRPKITLLIPFGTKNPMRQRTFDWLLQYWKHELPDAQIVIGHSHSHPFCKTEALNNGMERATGKVIVILDADAYLTGDIIDGCADRILEELDNHLWYVPYKDLYRLNETATNLVISSDPTDPLRIPVPPPDEYLDANSVTLSHYGHRYGAMIMMFPREALDILGCFDERFRGWGGEDVAFLREMDTLFGKHKITPNAIFHLWHPKIGDTYRTRMWEGQKTEHPNDELATQYHRATRNPTKMREIADAACAYRDTFAKRLQRVLWRYLYFGG